MNQLLDETRAMYAAWRSAVAGLVQLGLGGAVLCPGSRSAPLALSFLRGGLPCQVIVDERSAAYVALGWAKALRRPVALVCTSGTAGLNFAPAVAEAYWQDVSLMAFTADRPPEWIDRLENQTLYQPGMYARHVRWEGEAPQDYRRDGSAWVLMQSVSRAFHQAAGPPAGPVHLNVPLREPLYLPSDSELPKLSLMPIRRPAVQKEKASSAAPWPETDAPPERLWIVVGMDDPHPERSAVLAPLAQQVGVEVVADPLSNLPSSVPAYYPSESYLAAHEEAMAGRTELHPDGLVCLGGALVSKRLKSLLRRIRPKWHLRFDPGGRVRDPFGHLTEMRSAAGTEGLRGLLQHWTGLTAGARAHGESVFTAFAPPAAREDPERGVVAQTMQAISEASPDMAVSFHWGNSTPVRLWQDVRASGCSGPSDSLHYANRGTSGIDGCLSAALGMVLGQPERRHVLVLGDLSFFYDRNALWNELPKERLNILVLHNGGGGIFRRLPGAAAQPELEHYFTSPHNRSALPTAEDHGCRGFRSEGFSQAVFRDWWSVEDRPALWEVVIHPSL